jgi:DNA-binding response OmpR family regulator
MAHILLIDDDDSVRAMLRLTLNHFGHAVLEAKNGAEGLRLFGTAGADLVITDIVMPEKEGFGVLRELRKRRPSVKTIAISGGGRWLAADYLRIARQLGATKVLQKPFSNAALLAAVEEVLSSPPPIEPPAPEASPA